jgi:S-phase kinase-associated protein 1
MATMVKLISSEGSELEVDLDTAQMSVLIKSMIDDSGPEEDIPLPNVKKNILEKVIEFCQHLKDQPLQEIEKPLKTNNLRDIVAPWYADFVDVEQEMLFEIVLAANYLDIK